MQFNLKKFGQIARRWECLLIFIICVFVYLDNDATISAGDTIPNTLLAFNLLEKHTLFFDNFRGSYLESIGGAYFFANSINGNLISAYPIGPSIITFPLYILFYLYIKIANIPFDITSVDFDVHRLFFEKLAATITTAISVVLFYLASKLKFPRAVAIISTCIYAFATNNWMTSSQGLWQHGPSNLAVIATIYCLLKANRSQGNTLKILLVVAGLFCGLLPGIRPTSVVFLMAATIYSFWNFRVQSVFFCLGLVSGVPSLVWNWYNFGSLAGGYSKLFGGIVPYIMTFEHFVNSGLGLLISPSRGLLVFSPVIIYSIFGIYQVFKGRAFKDEQLIGVMTIASIFLFINYCFYIVWWGGHCYGPRFLTELMPVACYLINYPVMNQRLYPLKGERLNGKQIIFLFLIIFSIFAQTAGAFGKLVSWNSVPLDVDKHIERLWQVRDSQIQRNANALFHKHIKPSVKSKKYIQGLNGEIKEVADESGKALNSFASFQPGAAVIVQANLQNTGVSRWFGYEDALRKGETRVRAIFYEGNGQQVQEGRLWVSGRTKPHEETTAMGSIPFPQKAGTYKLLFDLVAEDVALFPKADKKNFYELEVNVK
jgi:hypothetical protein